MIAYDNPEAFSRICFSNMLIKKTMHKQTKNVFGVVFFLVCLCALSKAAEKLGAFGIKKKTFNVQFQTDETSNIKKAICFDQSKHVIL